MWFERFYFFRYLMSGNNYLYTSTEILSLRFNQDSSKKSSEREREMEFDDWVLPIGCFICATDDGIRVFNVEPFAQKCYLGNREKGSFVRWNRMIFAFRIGTCDLCRNALSNESNCLCSSRSCDWSSVQCWWVTRCEARITIRYDRF